MLRQVLGFCSGRHQKLRLDYSFPVLPSATFVDHISISFLRKV